MFEFLRPDKSPQNARMSKRLNTLKRKKRQTTHTPHPHNEKAPRSFANTTIAHSKFLMCIDAKFPPTQQSTPKFRNALKSKVSDYLKRPSKFPYTHEVREFLTIQRPNAPRPNTHTTPPKHFGVSDSLQNPNLSRGNFTPWGLDRPPPAPPRTGGNPSVCVPKNA